MKHALRNSILIFTLLLVALLVTEEAHAAWGQWSNGTLGVAVRANYSTNTANKLHNGVISDADTWQDGTNQQHTWLSFRLANSSAFHVNRTSMYSQPSSPTYQACDYQILGSTTSTTGNPDTGSWTVLTTNTCGSNSNNRTNEFTNNAQYVWYAFNVTKWPFSGTGGANGMAISEVQLWGDNTFTPVNIITLSLNNSVNGSSWANTLTFSNVTGTLVFSYFNITDTGFCVTYTGNGTGTNCTASSGTSTFFNVSNTTAITGTQSVVASTYQALLNITATQLFTNNAITGFNVSNNRSVNTTSTTSLTIPANNGSNTITLNHSGNYSKSQSCTATSLTTTSCTITGIYDNLFTIGARTLGNVSINNFRTIVQNNTLNSSGMLYNTSTTNGSLIFPLLQGYRYTFYMEAAGYAYANTTIPANSSTNLYNFTLWTTNSYNISFYDEQNGSLINYDNISIDFISDDASYNRTTSNGTLYIDLVTPGNYTLRYSGTQYLERFYQVTLSNNTYNQLDLTLLKISTGTNVTVNVIDNINRDLVGAIVKVLKYDVATNEYTINQIIETNFEGQGEITVTLNTEYYKFIIEYEGEVVLTTDPTYVYGTTLTFQVNPGSSGFEEALVNPDLSGTITFNNATGLATFTFNDETNTATQGCLYAYEIAYDGQDLINSTCTVSSSGTAAVSVTAGNATYLFTGYITHNGNEYSITQLLYSYTENAPVSRMLGLIITLILTVVLIFVARFNLEMAVVLGSLAPLLMSIAHLHSISIQASVAIFVLGLVTAYIIWVKK